MSLLVGYETFGFKSRTEGLFRIQKPYLGVVI